MLNKVLKKLKINQRTGNDAISNVIKAFLQEVKSNVNNEPSRFTTDDAKQLHLSLFILGEGKGATNKWLFYNSNGDVTTNEDVKAIAELCFGNFRLENLTDASKVHLYKPKGKQSRPPSTGILLSRVCKFSEKPTKTARCRNDTSQSSENDEAGERSSSALLVGSPSRNEGGSGSSRSSAYFSSTESIFSQSPGRTGSLPRETCPWLVNSVSRKSRVDISHRSSMDMFRLTQFMEVLDADPTSSSTNDRRNSEDRKCRDDYKKSRRLRCDLGFAVLFQAEDADFARRFRSFFFANFGCIESRMVAMCETLALVVEVNTANKCTSLCDAGFEKFKTEIHDLVFAPRLARPIWLALSSEGSCEDLWLYDVFLHRCLLVALDYYNSKQFVTSLVTAVLCHHLAWISTVEPVGSLNSGQSGHALTKATPDWQEHTPYNPHCAQMNDLYGLLGSPPRLSRTLIVGRDADLVEFFLFLTSYFLRCSKVARRFEELPNLMQPASLELLCVRTSADEAPMGSPPSAAICVGGGGSVGVEERSSRSGRERPCETTTTSTAVAKASFDSGVSSSEDIQAFIGAFPLVLASEPSGKSVGETSSMRPSFCQGTPPQKDGTVSNSSTGECSSATPMRMVCHVRHFEDKKAPYLEIPLLYGDIEPRTHRSNSDSPKSQEWEEEDDGGLLAWQSEGHSLLAGVHEHSTSFFALQGTLDPAYPDSLPEQLSDMLTNNGVNEEADEAVCVLVDTDRFTVQEYRLARGEAQPRQSPTQPAKCVSLMLAQVGNLARLNLSSDICLRYLEDQLQGIYMNALAFAQVDPPCSYAKALGHDKSDLSLLEAISSVHRPMVS